MCKSLCMSQTQATVSVPTWDVADRLRKSLREKDIGVSEMADYMGVSRNTVSTWINGRIRIPGPALRLWAMRTDVPLRWLETGELSDQQPAGNRPVTKAECDRVIHAAA